MRNHQADQGSTQYVEFYADELPDKTERLVSEFGTKVNENEEGILETKLVFRIHSWSEGEQTTKEFEFQPNGNLNCAGVYSDNGSITTFNSTSSTITTINSTDLNVSGNAEFSKALQSPSKNCLRCTSGKDDNIIR